MRRHTVPRVEGAKLKGQRAGERLMPLAVRPVGPLENAQEPDPGCPTELPP